MSDSIRPRRSVLYMPGSNARALEKAKTLPADAFIFNLEDAVSPTAKDTARDQVVQAVQSKAYGGRGITVRVNGPGTPWHEQDLLAVARAAPDAILIPKVSSPEMILQIEERLGAVAEARDVRLWAMMETPSAVLNAARIASASPRLQVLVLGTNDLARELRVGPTADRSPLLTALQMCVLAGRAAGLDVVDGVYNDIADAEGFVRECEQGRRLGFDGKTLVHPSQVEPCNRAYSPSADETAYARRILEAFEAARAEGRFVITVDGKMVEELHLENARRSLQLADAIARRPG